MDHRDYLSRVVAKIATLLHDTAHAPKGALTPHRANASDIAQFLSSVGVGTGSTLMVHSSWQRLNNGSLSARSLIEELRELVGSNGTVAMPAFPSDQDPKKVFSVKTTPSGAGLLTEVFRRYPGVQRSINLNHSVCALGRHATYLTADHHRSKTSWDEHSPYMKLRDIDGGAWVIGLGVGWRLKVATALHCADSALQNEIPFFGNLFSSSVEYDYIDAAGQRGSHQFLQRSGPLYTPKLARHYAKDELFEACVNGLDVYAIRADILIDKAIRLGRKGRTMYAWPLPWPWLFRPRSR